jgi:hypothetical protein
MHEYEAKEILENEVVTKQKQNWLGGCRNACRYSIYTKYQVGRKIKVPKVVYVPRTESYHPLIKTRAKPGKALIPVAALFVCHRCRPTSRVRNEGNRHPLDIND